MARNERKECKIAEIEISNTLSNHCWNTHCKK